VLTVVDFVIETDGAATVGETGSSVAGAGASCTGVVLRGA
jgi:hypothetical protein